MDHHSQSTMPAGWVDADFAAQSRPDVAALTAMLKKKAPARTKEGTPVVSVVTVVFNAIKNDRKEQFLQSLDSVQAQTGIAIEHLVIDGASKDGTVDLIKNYKNKNIPIRWLSAPDKGIYDAMNRGLYLARGKYVIFLNSDDFYSNSAGLADSVRRLEETGCDFSYAPITVLSESTGKPIDHLSSRPDVNLIFLEMPFCHQSIMLKREAMTEIGGFDLRYRSGADYDSILRLVFTGHRACRVETNFVSFRLGGFSFVNVDKSQQEVGTIFSRLYKKYLDVDLTPEEGKAIYITKQAPKILKQRQFAFARAAFGDAIQYENAFISIDGDLRALMNQLDDLSLQRGGLAVMRTIAELLLHTPLRFAKFLQLYAEIRKSDGKAGAKQKACDQLLAQLQAQRQSADAPAPEPGDSLCIAAQNYWCTNGLYAVEQWGAWTGKEFSVFFSLPEKFHGQALTAQIDFGGFIFPRSPKRVVNVIANGQKIACITLENLMPQMYTFEIPAGITASGTLDIDFIADQCFIPKDIGLGGDSRKLAMTFRQLAIRRTNQTNAPDETIPTELKIGFLNYFSKWWVGGITYFKNLFQAMETTESPHLVPYIMTPADENGDCLLPYATIFPQEKYAVDPENPPTAATYHMDMLSHLNGNQVVEGRDGIAWIADFQHLHLPEMFDDKEIAFRNNSFHSLIAENRIVCLSSYDAMEDFKKYAPEAAHKARCLHFVSIPDPGTYDFTISEAAEIRRKRNLPDRYFYVPNQFWKHKNHIAVLKAISILKKSGLSIHVVFSGNTMDARFPHYFEELEAFCREEKIEENIHVLGLIPLREVYFLMRDCIALINPSRFEGWSSSVEEAKSIGKTMILSNLNVHYEQRPPRGFYFPCDDPDWLADLMRRAWHELPPGPDVEMEKAAREQLPERVKEFGRDFQSIVLDAIANRSAAETRPVPQTQVTVITAIRDLVQNGKQAAFIRNLESVAAQTGVSVEHVIVDGNSTDGTMEFLKPYVEKFNCKLISEPVHNVYEAMNRGTIKATGKYVCYLNCNAYFAAGDFLKNSVSALEKGNSDFSYASVKMTDAAGAILADVPSDPNEAECFVEMPCCPESMLFARKALYAAAGFNDTLRFAGAYDLLLRLILSGKQGIRVPQSGVAVETLSPDNAASQQRECGLIFARHYSKIGFAMTPEEGENLYQQKLLPEKLAEILRPFCQKSFGIAIPVLHTQKKTVEVPKIVHIPQVSVLLPLPRSSHFLEERINSIARQKFTDFEVIVTMAELSQEDEARLNAWAKSDPRVQLYRESGKLWNAALAKARGKYVYFAVSDQSMSPDCLGHMAAALDRHPECSICDTPLQLIDQQSRPLNDVAENDRYFGQFSYPADREHVRTAPYDFYQAVCGKKVYASLCQLMIRRDLFALTGDFPENAGSCADYLWSLYASFYACVVYLPEKLASWRLNPDLQDNGVEWNFNEIRQCAESVLLLLPQGSVRKNANSLSTLLDFKTRMLCLKTPISPLKKLLICARAMVKYPRKSTQVTLMMIKFFFQHQPRNSSSRANNAIIAIRMKKHRGLIREGMLTPYPKFNQ